MGGYYDPRDHGDPRGRRGIGEYRGRAEGRRYQTIPAQQVPRTLLELASEKEFIDTLVACMSEQVQRIVREEFRRNLDRLMKNIPEP